MPRPGPRPRPGLRGDGPSRNREGRYGWYDDRVSGCDSTLWMADLTGLIFRSACGGGILAMMRTPVRAYLDALTTMWRRACSCPTPNRFQFKSVSTEVFVDDEKIARYAISPGDDIFLTGLFANHLGRHRNLPIVRCGNLAAMPEEPVATEVGPMEAFLIEARSIGGLSGSPCFVSLGQYRLIGRELQPQNQLATFLLGMVHGHWDAKGGDIVPTSVDEQETINKGIAIVIPAHHILETIRQESFAAEVAAEKQRYLELHGTMEDTP